LFIIPPLSVSAVDVFEAFDATATAVRLGHLLLLAV
jgi:hypothetical protein